jgi:hypothetical protein
MPFSFSGEMSGFCPCTGTARRAPDYVADVHSSRAAGSPFRK